jgi:secondary thiamine-phosphate synthase enzyme
MRSEVTTYDTTDKSFLDITRDVEQFASLDASDGLVSVFVPHATAGVALIETGSGSEEDLAATLERLLPRHIDYEHRHGSAAHGRDHVLPAFVAPSLMIPVVGGRLMLGTWQSVVLVDTNSDNPKRSVRFSFIPA